MAPLQFTLAVASSLLLLTSSAFAQSTVVVDASLAAMTSPSPVTATLPTGVATTTSPSSPTASTTAATVTAPAPKPAQRGDSPLIQFFQSRNGTNFSTLYAGIISGNLQEYFNDSSLAVTVFAPNNGAMASRLQSLTKANMITTDDLFSAGKSEVLGEILKYHVTQTALKLTDFSDGLSLNTLANLCSDAKDLNVLKPAGSTTIYLIAAGGTQARIRSSTMVGDSIVYEIDDILLPATVTVPLFTALGPFASGQSVATVPTAAIDRMVAAAPKAPPLVSPPAPSSPSPAAVGFQRTTSGRRLY